MSGRTRELKRERERMRAIIKAQWEQLFDEFTARSGWTSVSFSICICVCVCICICICICIYICICIKCMIFCIHLFVLYVWIGHCPNLHMLWCPTLHME